MGKRVVHFEMDQFLASKLLQELRQRKISAKMSYEESDDKKQRICLKRDMDILDKILNNLSSTIRETIMNAHDTANDRIKFETDQLTAAKMLQEMRIRKALLGKYLKDSTERKERIIINMNLRITDEIIDNLSKAVRNPLIQVEKSENCLQEANL